MAALPTVAEIADVATRLMDDLRITGSYEARTGDQVQAGWVGNSGGDDFEVVAVNIDTRDPDKPRAWLQDNNIPHLGFYADPTARIFQELKSHGRAFGMPTTLLLDRNGCEIASMAGPADWASADAIRLIEAAIAQSKVAPDEAAK